MKIYVGNLPFSVDDDKLRDVFSQFGEISEATVIQNKFSGRSKGFGFVTFGSDEDAQKAISEMNNKDVEGRKIVVNEAKPMDPDAPRRPRRDFDDRGSSRGGGDRGGDRGGFRGGGGFGGGRRERRF